MANSWTLCDTHCHIHDDDYPLPADEVLQSATDSAVRRILTMGSDLASSQQAINYIRKYDGQYDTTVRAGVGVYPQNMANLTHQTITELQNLIDDNHSLVAAIGEIGLDYYYDTVPRQQQISALEQLIQLAIDNNLPMSFHVRSGEFGDAFADFWPIINNFSGVRGVLHSFTDSLVNLDKVLRAGLYVGVNGILTFNRDSQLAEVYQAMPLERIVLETDAPYLAPKPYRGKVDQPAYIRPIAEYLADQRNITIDEVAQQTTANAVRIYPALA